MTTKNLPQATGPEVPASGIKTAHASSANVRPPMETIMLSHHLNIEGTDYLPGSKVRVPSDYARRLRRQGYVART
ncbi:hypothetical protein ACFW9M_04820 [Streptomyces lydicus]|uniref:hypothetical protein n=1 Tax=Streptomyces lydicus TaxID=47763 RepID=UPI0036A73125